MGTNCAPLADLLLYEKLVQTTIANNSTNKNKTNNRLPTELVEHKQYYDI